MAILGGTYDPTEDENQNPATQAGAAGQSGQAGQTAIQAVGNNTVGSGAGMLGAGGGSGGTPTGQVGGATQTAGQAPNPTSSGAYTNLMNYLGVNQQGGANLGQAVQNQVGQVGQQAQNALSGYQQAAAGDINAATTKEDPNAIAGIQNQAGQVDPAIMAKIAAGYTAGTTSKVDNPKAGAAGGYDTVTTADTYKAPDITAYNTNITAPGPAAGTYAAGGGPQDVSQFTGQTAEQQQAAMTALQNLTGGVGPNVQGGILGQTQQGLQGNTALLQNMYAQPTYNQGEQTLDSFLLGGTTGGQQALQQAQQQWGGLGQQYGQVNQSLADQMAAAKQASGQAGTDYTNTANKVNAQNAATNAAYQKAIQDQIDKAALHKGSTTTTANPIPTPPPPPPPPPPPTKVTPPPPPPPPKTTTPPPPPAPAGPPPKIYQPGQLAIDLGGGGGTPINIQPTNGIAGPTTPTIAPGFNSGPMIYQPGQIALSFAKGGRVPYANLRKTLRMDDGGDVMTRAAYGDLTSPAQSQGQDTDISGSLVKMLPMIASAFAEGHGGELPGEPKHPGKNDIRNDVVPILGTPKEIMLPLTVTQSKNPPIEAAKFVAKTQAKDSPEKKKAYDRLMKMCGGKV